MDTVKHASYDAMQAAMESNPECRCGGTGQIVHEFRGPDVPGALGVSCMSGSSTELCPCRRSMPRRYGTARWWTCESVHSADISLLGGLTVVSASVRNEVPISEDNYPLHRTADNCYWPPTTSLDIEGGSLLGADDLRELAAWLNKLADKMDEIGIPVPEEAKP